METFFVGGEYTQWRHFSLVENLLNGDIFHWCKFYSMMTFFVGGESTKWRHCLLVENLLNGDIFRWWRIY